MSAMNVSARDGKCAGFLGVPGIFTGDGILMMSWVADVISLIQTTPILFMTLKLFGGGYVTHCCLHQASTESRSLVWLPQKSTHRRAFVSYGFKMASTS